MDGFQKQAFVSAKTPPTAAFDPTAVTTTPVVASRATNMGNARLPCRAIISRPPIGHVHATL